MKHISLDGLDVSRLGLGITLIDTAEVYGPYIAVYHATGRRIRSLPITVEQLL